MRSIVDDGQDYEYVYDPFGRLRKILDESDQSLVAEYKYNGLGYRISVHQDVGMDGDVDANDVKFHFIYDDRWRHAATYRADDDDPKGLFLYHQAGLDGSGNSSYIDDMILRQRDADTAWTSAADGTLEERLYYCQNWRADVSAIITAGGAMQEWVKYSPYGVAMALPAGDTDSDFDCDGTDVTAIQNHPGAYDVRYDLDLNGTIQASDASTASNEFQGTTLGWNVLSNPDVDNRKGYAGYEWDRYVDLHHVRHRVYDPHLGRWTRRDPLGYVDEMSLYEYVGSRAVLFTDGFGLARCWGCVHEKEWCGKDCWDKYNNDPNFDRDDLDDCLAGCTPDDELLPWRNPRPGPVLVPDRCGEWAHQQVYGKPDSVCNSPKRPQCVTNCCDSAVNDLRSLCREHHGIPDLIPRSKINEELGKIGKCVSEHCQRLRGPLPPGPPGDIVKSCGFRAGVHA